MLFRLFAVGLLAALSAAAEGLFLWEVEGAQGKAYLLGSIHLAKPELYPLPDAVEEAFDAADTLVVEIDANDENEAEMAAMMLAAGVYGDGRRLSSEVSEETRELFTAYLQERGLPAPMFDAMRPWMAALTITIAEMQRLGFDPELGIDRHFLRQAAAAGKPVRQLESAEFQINLLAGFDEKLQEMFLLYTLKDLDRTPQMIDDLVAAWSAGDAARMEELLLEPAAEEPEAAPVYEKMFFERNEAMTKKISAMIEEGGVHFVVVGAGHLIGERGIVDLLAVDYEVNQVEETVLAAR